MADWGLIGQILTWLYFASDIALRIVAVLTVPYNRRPAAATAWLLAIMIQPHLGLLLFITLGHTTLPRGRRRKMDALDRLIAVATSEIEDAAPEPDWPDWMPGVVALNRRLSAMPLIDGNSARILPDNVSIIEAMVRAIDQAKHSVNVEFYLIVADDVTEPFFASLDRATARGVTVRVLVDHITSVRYPRRKETIARLDAMGAEWHDMLPLRPWRLQWQRPDLRNHRKLVVVDGKVGFTGSLNMIDPSYLKPANIRRGLHWQDLMVEFRGPVVQEIEALFIADWWAETNELLATNELSIADEVGTFECSVVPSGPGFEGENNLRLFASLLYNARERIVVVSPYFIPDDSILYALTTAAMRGVDVELFASEIGDQPVAYHAQRSYYETLLRAGVKITLYRSPVVLHSKHITIDDQVAVIGSSNLDQRSFTLNFEVSVMIRGSEFVNELRKVEDDYRAHSINVDLDEWMQRPRRSKVLDNVARLTSSLQ
ncbi:cardiolipin synthase [Humidisolicoccus flavus]|uniref:cardiolipin synthase n=1 Tax=Humidisolicoccus flavus TaxID=3111414 RepID=UPI00324B650C